MHPQYAQSNLQKNDGQILKMDYSVFAQNKFFQQFYDVAYCTI